MGTEDEFDEVRRMINRMLSDAVQGKHGHDPEPFVRGFAGRVKPDDATPKRFLVQVPADPGLPGPDVVANGDDMYVTMDLGGRVPTAVKTRVSGRLMLVEIEGAKPLQRVVELPCEAEPDVRWTLHDGVLDLALHRRQRTQA